MKFMNLQRWIALGIIALAVACIATSNIWVANLFGDDDEDDDVAEQTPDAGAADQAEGADDEADSDATQSAILSIDEVIAGDAEQTEDIEEVDPMIADLLKALNRESFAAGEAPRISQAGSFITLDSMRKGEGTASVYTIGENQRVLRLDPFTVTTGPDLHVLLSRHSQPRTSADALLPDYVDLGVLQSTSGAQNYSIPQEIEFFRYKSVVIYSISLNIIYSTATLEEVRG